MTTAQVAQLCSLHVSNALRLLVQLSQVFCVKREFGAWVVTAWRDPAPMHYGSRMRAAVLAWYLARGRALTNDEAAALVECSCDTAYRTLCQLSGVLPIYKPHSGRWQVLTEEEW